MPDFTSRCTWDGVSAARRSHFEYFSASRPMARLEEAMLAGRAEDGWASRRGLMRGARLP